MPRHIQCCLSEVGLEERERFPNEIQCKLPNMTRDKNNKYHVRFGFRLWTEFVSTRSALLSQIQKSRHTRTHTHTHMQTPNCTSLAYAVDKRGRRPVEQILYLATCQKIRSLTTMFVKRVNLISFQKC